MNEKEIRSWFENEWVDKTFDERKPNWLKRDKVRVVLLRDEINRFPEEKIYCEKLENKIKKLLDEIEILKKVEDLEEFSRQQSNKKDELSEHIPALDKLLMRMYGFYSNPKITERQLKELNEWRENEGNNQLNK